MKNVVAIIGGGTYSPIFNHMGLCSFARGGTARRLLKLFSDTKLKPRLYLSKMADNGGSGDFHTNDDLQELIDHIKSDPAMKIIVLTAAVCDFVSQDGGDGVPRPKTDQECALFLSPAAKIVRSIRDEDHKHIFVVAFKQTHGASYNDMYRAGLKLCKEASVNLVLVNDTMGKHNMIVTPEEAAYGEGGRNHALKELVDMTVLRSHLSFTRSTVVAGESVPWDSDEVPASLRAVVDHCIDNCANKSVGGATVGNFACKLSDNEFLTSIRRSNFNDLDEIGLVRVKTDGPDQVTAYGHKPSVGGQSQRLVFGQHKGMECIVHFHCPLKHDHRDDIEVRSQRELECGSHECGQNTSDGLHWFGNLKAVMLHKHGPNIIFPIDTDPFEVIDFIEANFDLSGKTGGYNLEEIPAAAV